MNIEILKSAKGNEQKQNKLAKRPNPKSPKPRQAHMPRKDKAREKKATLRLGYIRSKNRKQPSTFIIIYMNIDNERICYKKGGTFRWNPTVETGLYR